MPVIIHGKEYLTVAERVNQIHKDYKGMISITTEVLKFDDEKAMVKATAIIYEDSDAGDIGRIFTGHAFERADASRINATSYLEVCETSAIGRALAAASYGGSEFASADEVANAITEQANDNSKSDLKKPISHTSIKDEPPKSNNKPINKHAGNCYNCQSVVAEGEGYIDKIDNKWKVFHHECKELF